LLKDKRNNLNNINVAENYKDDDEESSNEKE